MHCPNCKSEEVKTYPILFEMGTTQGDFEGIGLSLGAGMSVGGFGGSTKSQTLLAKRVAPPKPPSSNMAGVLSLVTLLLAVGAFMGTGKEAIILGGVALVFAAMSALLIAGHFGQRRDYPKLVRRWQKSWFCLRCGRAWIHDP